MEGGGGGEEERKRGQGKDEGSLTGKVMDNINYLHLSFFFMLV